MQPIKKDKETGIFYRKWESSSPNAAFLLVHGLGAHSGRWEFLSVFFLRHNVSSYAIELKGFGETNGPRGHIDSFRTYFNDIRRLNDIIHNENPGIKVFLIGESMGGIISFLMAILNPDSFAGLICISPAFTGRLKLTPSECLKLLFPLHSGFNKEIDMPFTSEMCTRDADYQKIMDSDYRECRVATRQLLRSIALAQARTRMVKGRLKKPVLFLLSGDDKLVVPQASENVFKGLKVKDKEIIKYHDMYHALSIDLGRERVFEDILRWVKKHI